jgi:Ser/Thr protein kinase RdoA (MazF antagonist)
MEELSDLYSFEKEATKLQNYLDNGQIPLRVTHNDTKCNNVSFDKSTGEALAVLDLDTVMPGAIAHDLGDAIRFIANTVIEDDPDVDNVALDLDKYSAFAKGFISEVKNTLTDLERDTLNLGVFAMTVELAVRFLTDYLNGDKYFKTKYPGHNLDRARNQIALAKDIMKKSNEMDTIIKNYF